MPRLGQPTRCYRMHGQNTLKQGYEAQTKQANKGTCDVITCSVIELTSPLWHS